MGIKGIQSGVPRKGLCTRGCTKWSHVGLSKVPPSLVEILMDEGKSGFDVIRFAFKRLRDQPPLVNGKGEVMPEPNYDREEWKGWEARLTAERAEEVLDIKKEETPAPGTPRVVSPKETYIKVEEDLNNVWKDYIHSDI